MREVLYPSSWPRYLITAAVVLVGALTVHLFGIGFAHWALQHPGPALRHVFTLEYTRSAGILLRCVGTSISPSAPPQARVVCRRWFAAFTWYAGGRGANYLGGGMAAALGLAAYLYLQTQRRLRPRESEQRAASRFSRLDELAPFRVDRSPQARPEAGALPLGRTLRDPHLPQPVALGLPLVQRFQHVWVLGVTGAGKTSSAFKRWLATDARLDGWDGRLAMSSVVVDVKHPDIFTAIAPVALRAKRRVYVWAPFDEGGTTMAVNFLDYVPSPMDPQTAASLILSNMPDYAQRDPFWRGVERQLLTLLIQMVIEEPAEAFASPPLAEKVRHVLQLRETDPLPPPRSLAFVLALSYLSAEEFSRLFDMWPEPAGSKWRDRFATLQSAEERTIIGGMLGIQQALSVFSERPVILSTSYSAFRLETLAFQPTTLVIGLPTQPRPNRQVLTSLFLRQLLDVLGRLGEQRRPEGLPVPVTLYLDEIGTLGYIGNLPDYVATYRDIRVSFVLATQDTQQLVTLFGQEQAEVLVANLHTRVVFGYNLRPEQAARISEDLGERTIVQPEALYTGGALGQRRSGARLAYQVRPLMSPNELRSMPQFQALVVLPGDRKVRVYMEPVHLDPRFPTPVDRPLSWLHLYKHNALLDGIIGPPPRLDDAVPPPQATSPLPTAHPATSRAVMPAAPAAPEAVGAAQAPARTHAEPEAPSSPAEPEAGVTSSLPAPAPAQMPAAAPDREEALDLSEGNLVGFFRALVSGRLRDERVPDGTLGFVYADRRGEALVPWGYFMDFGRKANLRFVLLNSQWVAEKLVGPRVAVMHQGRAVTCMTFTKQACRMLPEALQQEVARRFRKVSPDAVRRSAKPSTDAASPQAPAVRATEAPPFQDREDGAEARQEAASLPFLAECLELLRERRALFEGHPDWKAEGAASLGRWRHVARNGEELLLVRRDVLEERIRELGGRPETVFAVWKGTWLLRPGEGDRAGYRIGSGDDRGHYLAFRWPALRALGFPGALQSESPPPPASPKD